MSMKHHFVSNILLLSLLLIKNRKYQSVIKLILKNKLIHYQEKIFLLNYKLIFLKNNC